MIVTTVAYSAHHKMLAADRRVTENDRAVGQVTKITKLGGLLIARSGSQPAVHACIDWLKKGAIGDPPSMQFQIENEWMTGYVTVFLDDLHVEFIGDGKVQWARAPFFVGGTGGRIALGAMLAGATPEEAVRLACTQDIYSGDGIDVLTLP